MATSARPKECCSWASSAPSAPSRCSASTRYKNVLSAVVNAVAAVSSCLRSWLIDWPVVVLIGVGSFLGGLLGARIGRRIPPPVLRGIIVSIGVVAIVKLVVFP